MQNNADQTLGFKRPFLSSQSVGLNRPFSEMDFRQIMKLKDIVLRAGEIKKVDVGEIEPYTVSCVYKNETFFSMFAEQGIIYEVFYDQIRRQES